MLHLYQSNRLEHLAALMVKLQQLNPLTNPLATQKIIIQSQGMRRYITQYLAKEQGIAANIHFQLPADLSWQLMRDNLPNLPTLNPFASEVMRWRLLKLFQSNEFKTDINLQAAYRTLNPYLKNNLYSAYQLAGQLADIFDQYLVYRPDWLEKWSKQQPINKLANNPTAIWQAQLWCHLDNGEHSSTHRAKLWQQLLQQLNQPTAQYAPQYYVFGIANLAPMYLTLLQQLAQHSEVHILALNPSEHYWGKIIEPATILQNNSLDLSEQGHPLLASLGKQGRDFFNQLNEAQAQLDISSYDSNPLSGSLLHNLQHHIQTQTLPEIAHTNSLQQNTSSETTTQDTLTQLKEDTSIQIHAAHSPLRELQILKDQLLKLLAQHPQLQPHDIAVLTPNIEAYAPFIEAVFGKYSPDGQTLPYSIADIKHSSNSQLMLALTQLLHLLNSRFEANKVITLLEYPIIHQRFHIQPQDLPLINEIIKQLNIRWGADANQRQIHGDQDNLYTWQQGLERLISGWLLPEQNNQLWQHISPFATNPSFQTTISQFIQFIQILKETHQQWHTATNISNWIQRLRQLINQFFEPSTQDHTTLQQLEQALNKWTEQVTIAQFNHPIDLNIINQHINHLIDSHNDAGFLKGGITFCSMVPMRSIPFAILCLLGLNDGDFPRATTHTTFDLISQNPRSGDRARRNDDRYLFLESILSARHTLYLSYIGKDIRTDEERTPSVLINELIDTIAAQTGLSTTTLLKHWIIQHPLQPFSTQYFTPNAFQPNSRHDYAEALNTTNSTRPPFYQPHTSPPTTTTQIDQTHFIRFWRNPLRSYLNQFNWKSPYIKQNHLDTEPFDASHSRQISDAYLKAKRQQQNLNQIANTLHAQNYLPAGLLGQYTQQSYLQKANHLDSHLLTIPKLPATSGTLIFDHNQLHYQLNHNTTQGQIIYADQFLGNFNQTNQLTAPDKIELLLLHLIYCATQAPKHPQPTILISLDQIVTLPAIETQTANHILKQWINYYQQGQHTPLPFLPRLNLNTFATLFKAKNAEWDQNKLQSIAAKQYHNNTFSIAQLPEIQLIYGRTPNHPTLYETKEFTQLYEDLLLPLKDCILVMESTHSENT